jgi:formylglycine-generating enzyme required for sulfatase activity
MLGNVMNWCQDEYKRNLGGKEIKVLEDIEDSLDIGLQNRRVLRGGSFQNLLWSTRTAARAAYVPSVRHENIGFRPARTIAP